MIYDFYKVKKQKNYLTSFDHARKNVQAYATALKEFNECRDNFLAELVPVKAGESVPLGKGWNAYIISVDAAADTGKYSLKYFPYSGRHKPVISASTPNPVCFQTVDSDPAREEFKAMTGLSLEGGGKRDAHCLKILNMARARLLRLEEITNAYLGKMANRFCPFEKGQAIYSANPKIAFGEKNIALVNRLLPLKLDPISHIHDFFRLKGLRNLDLLNLAQPFRKFHAKLVHF